MKALGGGVSDDLGAPGFIWKQGTLNIVTLNAVDYSAICMLTGRPNDTERGGAVSWWYASWTGSISDVPPVAVDTLVKLYPCHSGVG